MVFSFPLIPWRRLSLVVLILLVSLLPAACGGGGSDEDLNEDVATVDKGDDETAGDAEGEGEEEEKDKKSSKRRERTTSVRAARVVQTDLVVPIIAEGTVRARHSAEVRFELEGRLTRIYINDGETVRKGQVIAAIDAREYEVAAEEARSRYLEALSLLAIEQDSLGTMQLPDSFKKQMKELERLERSGKITHEERLAREIKLEVEALKDGIYRVEIAASRSGVSAARTSLERARLNLERTKIRAPFDGVITGLVLSEGEQVSKGQTICSLINNVDIEAEVGVLEADMANLETGRPALLVVPALTETLHVQVDVISPHFDRSTRTCQVLLRFRSEQGRIRPGMFVRAIIAGETFKDKLLVPKEAILTRDGRPLLFKIEEDRSKWLYLRLGKSNDYLVEVERVLQGGTLAPDDLVIVSDHLTLAHDAKVKVKKTVGISDPWSSAGEDN
jgi:HlyD family secretion protein